MTTLYKDWAPTVFDSKGLMLDDRQDWIVVPVMQTRDSGPLDESNFAAALRILGGESETVEVHRFGHWGPGWFEIIIAAPELADKVDEIEASLADYPVLDESDYSEREWEKASEWWMSCGMRERIRICDRFHESIFAARRDEIPEGVEISYLAE
jgi:hypothetical protein